MSCTDERVKKNRHLEISGNTFWIPDIIHFNNKQLRSLANHLSSTWLPLSQNDGRLYVGCMPHGTR